MLDLEIHLCQDDDFIPHNLLYAARDGQRVLGSKAEIWYDEKKQSLAASGMSSQQIAQASGLLPETVEAYLKD